MKENWDSALAAVLHHEGGFVHHPSDPGGITNLGCTKTVWEEFCGHPVTEQDMRALQPNDVAPLYRTRYWDKVKGDQLPAGVDYVVFDAAINSGPGRAPSGCRSVSARHRTARSGPVPWPRLPPCQPPTLLPSTKRSGSTSCANSRHGTRSAAAGSGA